MTEEGEFRVYFGWVSSSNIAQPNVETKTKHPNSRPEAWTVHVKKSARIRVSQRNNKDLLQHKPRELSQIHDILSREVQHCRSRTVWTSIEYISTSSFLRTNDMLAETIGLIGGGQMARALAGGWIRAGLVKPGQLVVHDPSAAAIAQIKSDISGIQIASDNTAVLKAAKIVIVAVKPQVLAGALGALSGSAEASPAKEAGGPLLVSIVAGWTLARLRELVPGARWVRVMPNTPCLVGESASGFAAGPDVTDREKKQVQELLTSVGRAWELPEHLLDAVTGLSGSGPAYAFLMIEALSDGGVRMGLPRDVATALAAQTLRGAATMVLSSGDHPGVLKDRVASPAGTTIAGLYELENHGVRGALIAAVTAATERSRELAKG